MVHPAKPIISLSGDSAIGLSGMEIETACRYQLPVQIVVFNNGGIGPRPRKGRPFSVGAVETWNAALECESQRMVCPRHRTRDPLELYAFVF